VFGLFNIDQLFLSVIAGLIFLQYFIFLTQFYYLGK